MEKKFEMKICLTCAFWSPKLKGFCRQIEQGTGKFWSCESWKAKGSEDAPPEKKEATNA